MLETLNELDTLLFYVVNVVLANPVTDFTMPKLTNDNALRVLYGLAMALLLWRGNTKMRWLVLASALVLLLTDQISAGWLKPMIERARPCHTFDNIRVLVDCGGGFAMPSAHAANAFGQAALFSMHYSKVGGYLILFALLIAVSRIFVGVHYPGDIMVGMIIGSLIGLTIAILFRTFEKRIVRNAVEDGSSEG
jgi:undecaprenyl-diphosphatase